MTDSPDPLMSFRSDLQLLTRDLGCVSGTLEEIATVWRRARQCRPDLPLGLPLRLETATRQLAAIADDLARAEPGQQFQLAYLMTEQMSVICQDHGTRALPRPRDHLAAAVSSWCVRRGPSS